MLGNLRNELKRATSAVHRALEERLLDSDAFTSRAGYIRFLRGQYRVHAALEPALREYEGLRQGLPDLPQRLKTAAIARDLRDFGVMLPSRSPRAEIDSEAAAWGSFYVIEGSMLGARRIEGWVRRSLRLEAEGGLRFLRWYGDALAERWSTFVAALETRAGGLPRDAVLDGAQRGFVRVWTELGAEGLISDPPRALEALAPRRSPP